MGIANPWQGKATWVFVWPIPGRAAIVMSTLLKLSVMPPEPTSSQNINISNSNLKNSPLAQAQGNINQSQQIGSENVNNQLQPSEVVALLDQLRDLLDRSNLPEDQKKKAIVGIETAKCEAEEEEPDNDHAGKGLARVIKALKSGNEVLSEGTSLWERAEPILRKVLPYFGIVLTLLV